MIQKYYLAKSLSILSAHTSGLKKRYCVILYIKNFLIGVESGLRIKFLGCSTLTNFKNYVNRKWWVGVLSNFYPYKANVLFLSTSFVYEVGWWSKKSKILPTYRGAHWKV